VLQARSVDNQKSCGTPTLRKLTLQQAKQTVLEHAREFMSLLFPHRAGTRTQLRLPEDSQKCYEKPEFRKLTPEQARLLLVGYASIGDQGASDLMELVFPEQDQPQSPFSQ
jgi:hypothetical protein